MRSLAWQSGSSHWHSKTKRRQYCTGSVSTVTVHYSQWNGLESTLLWDLRSNRTLSMALENYLGRTLFNCPSCTLPKSLYIKNQPSIHRGTCFVVAAGVSICRLFYFEKSFALSRHLSEGSDFPKQTAVLKGGMGHSWEQRCCCKSSVYIYIASCTSDYLL